MPFTESHPSHVLTYPPSMGPAHGGLTRSHSFFPNQWALACPFAMVAQCAKPMPGPTMQWPFMHLLPLLYCMLWAPTPWVLQWWLYQPCQQTQHQKCPGLWQVQCPPMAGSAPSSVCINAQGINFPCILHDHASEPKRVGRYGRQVHLLLLIMLPPSLPLQIV